MHDWHFPRTQFTLDKYNAMTSGGVKAHTLFGERRTGKTTWLLHDLAVLAAERGHRVAYMSFWEVKSAPLEVMAYRMLEALQPRSFTERLMSWTGALPLKAKFAAKGPMETGEIGVEFDFSDEAAPPTQPDYQKVSEAVQALSDPAKPAFLLFDEVQEIARSPRGEDVIAALRTMLDTAQIGVRSVFTGSSEVELRVMFDDKAAPFFNFAVPITLPELDDEFVLHQLAAYRESFRRDISDDVALNRFRELGANPELFQRWIRYYGSNKNRTLEETISDTKRSVVSHREYQTAWRSLTLLQRQMARLIAEDQRGLTGKNATERIRKWSPNHVPKRSELQTAQRFLKSNGYADSFERKWQIKDDIFRAWILDRSDEDFE